MNKPITMRELQKISTDVIDDLPNGLTPIQSRGRTVGYLQPVRTPRPPSSERVAEIECATRVIEEWQASWTPEMRAAANRILEERGIADWA